MKQAGFLLIILLLVPFALRPVPLFAQQETVVQTDTPVGIDTQATKSATPVIQNVDYELAYPGMLPDNPFYFLKVLRDGFVKLLINDPLKRAEFSLLNSDKRMYAGKFLADKNNGKLSLTTISKSNNYANDALTAIVNAKKKSPKDPEIGAFLSQFKTAMLKHHEVAENIREELSSQYDSQLQYEEKRIDAASKTVDNLLQGR